MSHPLSEHADTAEPVLFEVDPVPVKVPKRTTSSQAKPRWTKYRPKFPLKCDDCMLVLALAKGAGPPSRQAKFRRKQGAGDLLLCYAHAQARRDEDGMKPLEDD
jgi:hypothetical protein